MAEKSNKRAAFVVYVTVIVPWLQSGGSMITVADSYRAESTGYPHCG
jgi:hypothetical protein